ncbi:hypothetical protein VHEMI06719 [[Torrubiella] hemipterigena]|uniref:Nitrilase n=1 Tax=[Torrubiella] hemipterigena TaxID=1531966 RepID=A0A0A1TJS6_9HYPO|nr:hypothetical protein VHEMI06719 [[Torrubiella] hemipterigena]
MTGRKRALRGRGGASNKLTPNETQGDIYTQMLAEAGVAAGQGSSMPQRPIKRMRRDKNATVVASDTKSSTHEGKQPQEEPSEAESDEDMEFEDVALPEINVQTMEMDSEDDDDSDEDADFEDIGINIAEAPKSQNALGADLELNLTAQKAALAPAKNAAERRRPISKEEREKRTHIHKTHILCLLSHVARRNHWCNDAKVQASLRKHLSEKTAKYLTPASHLPQFGQMESLKTGLKQAAEVWRLNFEITERGMRRALWAEDPEQLDHYTVADDLDSCMDREAFREAATLLQGSRDVGAQLYCALLRSVGVRARLVCSLQPLAFGSGAPTLPKPKPSKVSEKAKKTDAILAQIAKQKAAVASENNHLATGLSAKRRLGHPNAAAYNFEPSRSPVKATPSHSQPRKIRESLYPVYWVEVLDTGHQKWQPADPVVTHTFWKPKSLEPPITDKENSMSYVVAFDADGSARDVTVRYAKAYAAKTRKLRVDAVEGDDSEWWRRVMKLYRPRWTKDLDQIETNELAGIEMREPMPRNVQDFKGHPVFALERHMRRHEVLTPDATPSGTINSGPRGALEKIYRRRDVRVAKTVDKWYRLGREVKPNEIPAKWLPKKVRRKPNRFGDDDDDDDNDNLGGGVPIYTEDQTELYEPPPVRNGRVPKNKFGNIEVYVPSMVPKGGVHIVHEQARRAAFLAGIDHAPALTGFDFKGRQGTAVLSGIVVASEFAEAIYAIVDGLGDLEAQMEEERRTLAALKMWRRFMMGLRIRERIWSGVSAEERHAADKEAEAEDALDAAMEDAPSDATEEFDMMDGDDSDAGGGFLVE